MSLNGEIHSIRKDEKSIMYISVAGSDGEIILRHRWPKFQQEARVGDYVIKEPKKDSLVLIKRETKIKIICPMRE
jgi:hypothetical protein